MSIFFAASSQGLPGLADVYKAVLSAIEKHGDSVLPSWITEDILGIKSRSTNAKQILLRQNQFIQECDAMIVETSTPSFGVGYLIGQALNSRKPILCLYPEERALEPLSDGIKGNTSSLINLERYSKKSLPEVVDRFLDGLDLNSLQKFNFVASKEVIEYIRKGAAQEGKSQSEFLRDKIIRDLMPKNQFQDSN